MLIWVQGIYYLLTALWGLIDINSFMEVTGPKTDIWLVKTVSVLLFPIIICLFAGLSPQQPPITVILVGISASAAFAFIDFYYTADDTIRWVYAVDGCVQAVLLLLWLLLLANRKSLR